LLAKTIGVLGVSVRTPLEMSREPPPVNSHARPVPPVPLAE
jgi:hypothetical protein